MNKIKTCCAVAVIVILCVCLRWAVLNSKMHDFEGKCKDCHLNVPGEDWRREDLIFVEGMEKVCERCHSIDMQKSHPIKVKPKSGIPLAAHLDKGGFLTCATCHDVHKENKTSNPVELSGLLWGHAQGRAFCSLCHEQDFVNLNWRHQTAISKAHSLGKLQQIPFNGLLDEFSTECLSCHDDTISRFPQVEVKGGVYEHSAGASHPIGVDYPRSGDFNNRESLPLEIRIFNGKLGCLTCHEIYNSKEDKMLAMNNRKSRMCLTCHKK